MEVSLHVPVVIVLGLCKGSAPEGLSWSLMCSTPTFPAGGRQMSPHGLYLHNLLYISIEGQ